MMINSLMGELEIRAASAKGLSQLFRYPGDDISIWLESAQLITEAAENNIELKQAATDIIINYENCDKLELQVEFTRLFIGPFGVLAPLYGSFYLDGGTLMGKSTTEIDQIYNNAGLGTSDESYELPDNIAIEMEFIYFLSQNAIEQLEKRNEHIVKDIVTLMNSFIERYIISWGFQLCTNIESNTNNPYFESLAALLRVYLLNAKLPEHYLAP